MKTLVDKISSKAFSKKAQIKVMINKLVQPFTELPPVQNPENDNDDRINAHDLFSKFTADIIKEDTMFTR